jgi:hypothetical protein
LRKAYEGSLADPGLMDLEHPIALIDSAVQRLSERVEDHDTIEFRKNAITIYEAVGAASRAGNAAEAAEKMNELGRLLRAGGGEDSAMRELIVGANTLARRIEGAWGVRLARQQSINAGDLVAVLGRLVSVIRDETGPTIAVKVIARLDEEISRFGAYTPKAIEAWTADKEATD